LLGDNGTGKTTLFRILTGEEKQSSGDLFVRSGAKTGYLQQQPETYEQIDVINVLMKAFQDITSLQHKIKDLENQLASSDADYESMLEQLGNYQIKYEALGGYDIEEKLSKIIEGMKLSHLIHHSFNTLSGGEKMRVSLSKLLLESPDVLLLDEPTNHLDIETTEWLEEYLKSYEGSVMIISHDRYFLDRVIDKIYEIKQGHIDVYHGNYSYYLEERELRYELQMREYNTQLRKVKQLEAAAKRMRDWANRADNEKMYKRAKAIEKRVERMDKPDKPIKDLNMISLQFEQETKAGKIIFEAQNHLVTIAGLTLASDVSFKVYNGERIGLIGANGCGKSTLIRQIMALTTLDDRIKEDEDKLLASAIRINPRANIGYLEQDITFHNEDFTILESLNHTHPMNETSLRKYLAKFKFKQEDVFKRVSHLSGGERVRLKLSMLMLDDINVMILDEPTNHIDIKTKEVLEEALQDFDGTILFVSHDRYFLNKMATRIFDMADGKVYASIGNYEYYREERDKRLKNKELNAQQAKHKNDQGNKHKAPNPDANSSPQESKSSNKEKGNPWKRKSLEDTIEALESQIAKVESDMLEHASDYDALQRLESNLQDLQRKLEVSMEEYFALIE
jgi:ATPase subunit of ABC transporter with duplicated ATPase domains